MKRIEAQERLKMNQNVANPLPPNFAELLAVNIGNVVRKEIETVVPSGKIKYSGLQTLSLFFIHLLANIPELCFILCCSIKRWNVCMNQED